MNLVINEVEIGTDEDGRYSLNDLHKAAGGEKNLQPNYFMRTKEFKGTVEVLTPQNSGIKPVTRKAGRYNGGTWICEELVIDYAMWVSPEFKVKVIQTFLALSKGDHDKASAIISNNRKQLDIIKKRDQVMASSITPGKKADKLALLEKEWLSLGSDASKALAVRRGQSFKFSEAQDRLLNDIQTSFEF